MIVFINPASGGGTALAKWRQIEGEFRRRWGACEAICIDDRTSLQRLVAKAVALGDRRFVAAGGDGTVNALVTALLGLRRTHTHSTLAVGALGLGSSNDFHKPLRPDRLIRGVPCTVDFPAAKARDVGVISFPERGHESRRFFLLNASVGITAEANRFFNTPDTLLAVLKRGWTNAAILYAAMRTLLTVPDIVVKLSSNGGPVLGAHLTNLAVLKSPHVSGSLRFPGELRLSSGLFDVHLAYGLSTVQRLRLITALRNCRIPADLCVRSWSSPHLELQSDTYFTVEFDGEIITSRRVTFSILPSHLRVCPC